MWRATPIAGRVIRVCVNVFLLCGVLSSGMSCSGERGNNATAMRLGEIVSIDDTLGVIVTNSATVQISSGELVEQTWSPSRSQIQRIEDQLARHVNTISSELSLNTSDDRTVEHLQKVLSEILGNWTSYVRQYIGIERNDRKFVVCILFRREILPPQRSDRWTQEIVTYRDEVGNAYFVFEYDIEADEVVQGVFAPAINTVISDIVRGAQGEE